MFPSEIKVKEKKTLHIKWNDGTETSIKLANLRINCPCAVCSEERLIQGSKYIPIYSDAQLKISSIEVVGNYAVAISWSDSHNTGIFDFDYLKKLSDTKG
jgi:DUF971 family protein